MTDKTQHLFSLDNIQNAQENFTDDKIFKIVNTKENKTNEKFKFV